ncbi:LysR family transcriptional regulator [Rhizobium sp. FY34]|uniref:LysR family transcriptional regulator n=1 Tax=Rhizobium sp. FY34 TaxID=2562309 RepID=UPI0010BFF816|nr:LysR family transcriptional regulator [Rhizobium sp. FY34]
MELNWLEDFMELAAVRNFSTAAAARHVTQPAFSRRIRALENWIGTELVDRSSYPVKLTNAGETFLESGRELMREIYRIRDECRQQARAGIEAVTFSALHTIALSIFPNLLVEMESRAGPFISRMHATDFYDCVESLALGRCDIALCYSHELGPPVLQTGQFASKIIRLDPFYLVSKADSQGKPLVDPAIWPSDQDLPLVAYSADCFLGKVQAQLMLDMQKTGHSFRVTYENSMSEAVKRMILAGKGVGWLPQSAADREVEQKELCLIDNQPVTLSVLAIRKQGVGSVALERFWSNLREP